MKQDYVIKKHVRAESAAEAMSLDTATPVHEVFLSADKLDRDKATAAVGFLAPLSEFE